MAKRSWAEANSSVISPASSNSPFTTHQAPAISPAKSYHSEPGANGFKRARAADNALVKQSGGSNNARPSEDRRMPTISRKVKACAACRKQKIKCMMTGDPPCQRCKERGLSCRLNKSLQTLMSEDSRWKSSVTKDLGNMYASLEQVLQTMSLPALPPPQIATHDPAMFFDTDEQPNEQEDEDQSYDNSPKVSPVNEHLAHVPIESLYQITGMRALRAHEVDAKEQDRICKQLKDTDFMSRNQVSVEDAEHLVAYYLTSLDPYVWHLAGQYQDLESFRRRSPTLTACILTVAALHDTTKQHLYPTCSKEFRRLVSNAMFERRIDMEYLRALVIGAYWLSDTSWVLSGYAIRRASEFHLRQFYQQIVDSIKDPSKYTAQQLEKAMDGMRLLYLLYICDHHLSILYGRSSIMRDKEGYITGWEAYLASSLATDSDKRIASQVSLLYLMNQFREAFGPEDTATPLPASCVPKIAGFERDLDNWVSRHTFHNPNKHIGNWPMKGVIIHYHFAKLYLGAYSLRGLSESSPYIPEYFLETASAALNAARAIVDMLLEDEVIQKALGRVPHYFHGMIAFACMFLLKAATKHNHQLFVDRAGLASMMAELSQVLQAADVGKEHLAHRMAEGLEKMAQTLGTMAGKQLATVNERMPNMNSGPGNLPLETQGLQSQAAGMPFDPLDPNSFGFGDMNLSMGMPFFDFEGTSLGFDGSIYASQ